MEGVLSTFFTELLFPLISLLLTGFAIPAMVGFMKKNKIEVNEKEVVMLQNLAKNSVRLAEVKVKGGPEKFEKAFRDLADDAANAGISMAKHNITRYVEAAHSEVFGEKK